MIYYLQAVVQPSVEYGQPESKDSSNLPLPRAKRGQRASADFMDVTLVTEDDPSKLQNKMSQSQETPKDPGEMDKGKAKKKTGDVKSKPADDD